MCLSCVCGGRVVLRREDSGELEDGFPIAPMACLGAVEGGLQFLKLLPVKMLQLVLGSGDNGGRTWIGRTWIGRTWISSRGRQLFLDLVRRSWLSGKGIWGWVFRGGRLFRGLGRARHVRLFCGAGGP